jgi:methionyl-tRNA formyltransferase
VRTVYLGTSLFAVAVLERLAASPHRPQLVVTRPDKPRGRGRKLAPPPVAEAARNLGIDLIQPVALGDPEVLRRVEETSPETICVCAYGAMIREPLLSLRPMLNVHPSLLPRWRGAAPVERAIMAGDAETGVSIMQVTAGLDSGPVCLVEREPIGPRDTYGSLGERLQRLGGELLVRALDERPAFTPQDDAGATYAEKITAADRVLDPSRPAAELDRVVRALTPHIGAQVALADGDLLGVLEARPEPVIAADPGVDLTGRVPLLQCAEGALALLQVKPAGKRAMRGEDWLRGLRR